MVGLGNALKRTSRPAANQLECFLEEEQIQSRAGIWCFNAVSIEQTKICKKKQKSPKSGMTIVIMLMSFIRSILLRMSLALSSFVIRSPRGEPTRKPEAHGFPAISARQGRNHLRSPVNPPGLIRGAPGWRGCSYPTYAWTLSSPHPISSFIVEFSSIISCTQVCQVHIYLYLKSCIFFLYNFEPVTN